MKNSMGGLVDKVKGAGRSWKNTARTGVLVGAGVLGTMAGSAKGQTIPISSFKDFIVGNNVQTIRMKRTPVYDNLKNRDPNSGTDSVVSGPYHMGFIKYDDHMNADVVGYADNLSTMTFPGREGWMRGYLYSQLGYGNKPDDVWTIYDANSDGLGIFDTDTGEWFLGEDDVFYGSRDILLGVDQIRGDVNQLPAYLNQLGIIPSATIKEHTDEQDLRVLGENWLRTDADSSNAWANGADWNRDRRVDNKDLAILASKYRPVVKAN